MITICLLLTFLGFYAGYVASEKAAGTHVLPMREWARKNASLSRAIGLGFIVASGVAFSFGSGIGAGLFLFFISLMTIGSMIVLLSPLHLIKTWMIALVFVLFFLSETALN